MTANDWLGPESLSWRERAERVVREAVRRAKLEGRNDPNFVPPPNDVSAILAGRHFVLPPPMPERGSNDANDVLASRVFSHGESGASHGTPFNLPWTLVQRDAGGNFAASIVAVVAIQSTAGVSYDFILLAPDGTTHILRVPTGTVDLEALGKLTVAAKVTVQAGGADITGNSKVTGTLLVTGQITGNLTGNVTGNASTATSLSHGAQTVSGAGSSAALHDLIAKLNNLGANLTDSTTP